MGTITVKNLRLKTIIGFFPKERIEKQDVIITYHITFNSTKPQQSDSIDDTIDYKKVNKAVIALVEESSFNLLEKLCSEVLSLISQDGRVIYAKVEVDKPEALRGADSVSFSLEYKNPHDA